MTNKQGWLFTLLTAVIVSPAIYNEFAPKEGDERATPAMRVVTPKGQTKANLMPHNMAEGVLNLSNTPAFFNELGHGHGLASPNRRVAQPRKLASSTWAGQPGDYFLESGQ